MKKVCVFGTYKDLGEKEKADITRLGRLLAEKGVAVVSGGFGGSMEYVSQGAKSAGGKTIGVTYYKDEDISGKRPNDFVDEEIKAGDIFERIHAMMETSDGFIVLQGGTGTLLELAAILEHINKGMMSPKPIIAIGNFWRGVVDNLSGEAILSKKAKAELNVNRCGELVIFAQDVDEAVKEVLKRI